MENSTIFLNLPLVHYNPQNPIVIMSLFQYLFRHKHIKMYQLSILISSLSSLFTYRKRTVSVFIYGIRDYWCLVTSLLTNRNLNCNRAWFCWPITDLYVRLTIPYISNTRYYIREHEHVCLVIYVFYLFCFELRICRKTFIIVYSKACTEFCIA